MNCCVVVSLLSLLVLDSLIMVIHVVISGDNKLSKTRGRGRGCAVMVDASKEVVDAVFPLRITLSYQQTEISTSLTTSVAGWN